MKFDAGWVIKNQQDIDLYVFCCVCGQPATFGTAGLHFLCDRHQKEWGDFPKMQGFCTGSKRWNPSFLAFLICQKPEVKQVSKCVNIAVINEDIQYQTRG